MNVEEWFEKNKFKCDSFRDINRLVNLKNEQNIKISVVIPTLNEGATLGNVIKQIKEPLMDDKKLVDEVIVIDSGSTDDTKEVAESAGAKFAYSKDVLKKHGEIKGKGENLWKSIHYAKGDIVCWVDADITNIHPRFVYGLIGPLLTHKRLGFTKAFYQRPIKIGNQYRPLGGGRVTELLIRPLFNTFFPRLSGFIQPLSGEFAMKREIAEKIPFFTGYGVETASLIDIQKKFGLRTCAQVDLKKRIHRNQTIDSLSKMAFGILGVFSKRANTLGKLILVRSLKHKLRIIVKEEGDYKIKELKITDKQRPPMITIPEYRRKFRKDPEWVYR
ncbi:MAG: glucosyl-3-phosphoglycerate synthase [Nanobdellota archaeon]